MNAPFSGSSLKAILGPTNTGKTWYAIERLLAHPSGMIGLPLRLLAREVYQTIVARVGAQAVALVTGEERITPASARYWVATVEAMPTDIPVDCVAIDEIQTAIDFDRGHVFTNRILHARGRRETLLLGAATMAPVIRKLLPDAEIIDRPRLSDLTWAGSKKISRQPPRSAIVAFSAKEVYAIAELIRRERGGAAVVMGALSPRTRNAQVELYQNGDVDFLVATDAIGMGLNLDVKHVAFAADSKFDGRQSRPLTPAEIGQIAGRAGRHTTNGSFGVTGRANSFEEDLIIQLETHDFAPVKMLQWRNGQLDFSTLEALRKSLEKTPDQPSLTRAPIATDQAALEFLSRNEAGALANDYDAVRLLWECCQIPDYRDISPALHGDIITKTYTDLMRHDHVDTDWIAEQVSFCDNISGDIDTLSNRIKQIRTWTFVANRKNWLKDPTHWREKTRDIEDRLSDALHEKLTQRFVDRRTGVLLRHLRDRRMTAPEINDKGEISLEGHLIGTIDGFRFSLSKSDSETDAKGLRSAAAQVVAPEIVKRAQRLVGAPNEEFVLATDGFVRWRGDLVGELTQGDDIFSPRILVLADESLTGPDLDSVQDRLNLWLRHLINTQLEQILTLKEPPELEGAARGVAFQLSEHLGLMPRAEIANEVKGLDQDVRGKMRKLGIKFGAYHIYLPQTLKPAPRELALILWALQNGGIRQPGVSDLPHIILSGRTSFEIDPAINPKLYEIGGFKVAGNRAVRVDILERLADIIRPLISLNPNTVEGELPPGAAEKNGFRVTVEMTSLLGCAGDDFASILKSLGYRLQRTPIEAAPAADQNDLADTAKLDGAEPVEAAATSEPTPEASDLADTAKLVGGADDAEATPPLEANVEAAQTSEGVGLAAEPEEPKFDEVWFPGGRRSDNQRPQHNRGKKPDGAPRQAKGKPNFAHRSGDKPKFDKNRSGKPGSNNHANRPPKRDKPLDPDSPFAALAALKDKI